MTFVATLRIYVIASRNNIYLYGANSTRQGHVEVKVGHASLYDPLSAMLLTHADSAGYQIIWSAFN